MADTLRLQVVTPDRTFYEGDVTMVELTTTEGQIGVYPKHIPLTCVIAPGVLYIHEDSEIRKAALISGFVEILPDQVTIMAEDAEWPDQIDAKRAEEARIRAERRIKDNIAGTDIGRAEMALNRALSRLNAIK